MIPMLYWWTNKVPPHRKRVIVTTAVSSLLAGGALGWAIWSTIRTVRSVVAAGALDRERRGAPEYLYLSDPALALRITEEADGDSGTLWPSYLGRRIGKYRRNLWKRYIHACEEGFRERLSAVEHLKKISHLEEWESAWVAQRLDARAAVSLARSGAGKNRRLLRTPPLPPQCRELNVAIVMDELNKKYPQHGCLSIYLRRHADKLQDIRRHMEDDTVGGSNESDRVDDDEFLLHSLLEIIHHIDMIHEIKEEEASPCEVFANAGGLIFLRKAASSERRDLKIASSKLLLKLCSYPNLLNIIHRSGLLENLSEWYDGDDPELKCIAGGVLASMEFEDENNRFREIYSTSVHLLHPIHRTNSSPSVDVVAVHGLLGEPFVTWRQRDRVFSEKSKSDTEKLFSLDFENELEDFDVVLRDIPESAVRDPIFQSFFMRSVQGLAELEKKELSEYTKCWPRDWLPHDCSNIRVLGVSYDTVMTEWGEPCEKTTKNEGLISRANILAAALRKAGVGSRPIVWITHSMGGLIVKQILVDSLEAKTDSEHDIANQTKGIIFFSTPHHGSRAAHILLWPSREVKDLREDCTALGKLHEKWLSGKWPCICIAESKPTQVLSIPGINPTLFLVPPSSADAGVGPFYTLPLDHLNICKPATRHSFIYRTVVNMVRHAKGEICTFDRCEQCTEKLSKSDSKSNKYVYWISKYFNKQQYDLKTNNASN